MTSIPLNFGIVKGHLKLKKPTKFFEKCHFETTLSHTWVPESACVISKVSIIPLLALALDGLLIGAPVDRVNGGRAFDLDVSSLCERFILHLQPKQNFQTKTFKLDRFRKRSSVEPYLFNSHRNANARFDLLQITWMFNFPIKPWPAGTAGLKYSRVC